ncbi:VWA domain-containing protein [Pseudonocardia saturnea]
MGLGRYQDGRFHLIASLRHDADQARIDEWRASFAQASRLLFEATDGQHRIGTLTFCNRSSAGAIADLWLEEHPDRAGSGHGGIGRPGVFAHLGGDERDHPFIVTHELGHLLYHLHDEYASASTSGSACLGDPTADTCIMEGGSDDGDRFVAGTLVTGRMRRFCVAGNHDPDGDTRQHRSHHESCWETMGGAGFDLAVPDGLPAGADPDAAEPLAFLLLDDVPRLAIVLDRSGSMAGDKLEQARIGAHFFVDTATDGDELAQVSFASAATVDMARHVIGPDREAEGFAVDTLTAQGETSIGDGLRKGFEQINLGAVRSSVQSVVLLTDGLQTHGESTSAVLPDLLRTLTRVFAVGIGPDIDEELLLNVATRTGGEFVRVDPDASVEDQLSGLRSAVERFTVLARDNGAVVDESSEAMTDTQRVVRSTVIEPGTRRATFVLSWPDDKDQVELELVDPAGQSLNASSSYPGLRVVQPERPYTVFQVQDPPSGRWRTRITCHTDRAAVQVRRRTFVDNPDLVGALNLPAQPVAPGDRVRATFSVAYGRLLTGVRLGARLSGPEGTRVRFRAGSFEAEAEGEYSASFRAPHKPGVHSLTITVRNDRLRTRPASSEGFQAAVPDPPVPDFMRRFTTTFVVAEVRRP